MNASEGESNDVRHWKCVMQSPGAGHQGCPAGDHIVDEHNALRAGQRALDDQRALMRVKRGPFLAARTLWDGMDAPKDRRDRCAEPMLKKRSTEAKCWPHGFRSGQS